MCQVSVRYRVTVTARNMMSFYHFSFSLLSCEMWMFVKEALIKKTTTLWIFPKIGDFAWQPLETEKKWKDPVHNTNREAWICKNSLLFLQFSNNIFHIKFTADDRYFILCFKYIKIRISFLSYKYLFLQEMLNRNSNFQL